MRIYLDHNATTPPRPEVVEATSAALRELYGNPSSTHAEGARARAAVEGAREQVAALVGALPAEVIFTGGATESNNLAIHGITGRRGAPGHAITTAVEHPSVAEPLETLAEAGWRVERLAVDADGRVAADAVAAAVGPDTALVSAIWANNETGVIQPVEAIAAGLAGGGVPLHVDATQAVGKIPVHLERLRPLDAVLLSASAHKFNGPKGVGFLVARGVGALEPWVRGGPQERRRRGGTHNVAGIVGLGVACALAAAELEERGRRYAALRDRLWEGIAAKVPDVHRNGSPPHVLPNTLNLEFRGAAGDVLLEALDGEGVAVSAGAACHSGSIEPSAVLTAMGRTPEQAWGSLRFSVGHGVDEAQIDRVLALLPDLVARVRRSTAP